MFSARTSPDTTELYIRNGRIIYGEKEYYNIGDEVTIQCDIGYILIGSPKINYIGGKQWLPNIPTCDLSKHYISENTVINAKSLTGERFGGANAYL